MELKKYPKLELIRLRALNGRVVCHGCIKPVRHEDFYWYDGRSSYHDKCRPQVQTVVKLECQDKIGVVSHGG